MQGMGFGYQPQWEGSCGVYSFKHAMNLLGNPIATSDAKKAVKHSLFRGVDELKIQKAIRNYGFTFIELLTDKSTDFHDFVGSKLNQGCPIILWFNFTYPDENDSGHWVLCGGRYNDSKYIIIDSAPLEADTNVISFYKWTELIYRCLNKSYDIDQLICFGMAINPIGNETVVLKFPNIVSQIMKNDDLADYWAYYLSDLIDIFDFKPKYSKN